MDVKNRSTAINSGIISTPAGPSQDSPGVIVFPPLLYAGTWLFGLLLQLVWPVPIFGSTSGKVAGMLLLAAGGTLALWGSRTMKRAGTNVLPSRPTLTIVSEGPFRFTRNPIYVANAAAYMGLTLVFDAVWPLLLFLPMLLVLYWGIVRREERYLQAKFGNNYLAYQARVRRWL